MIDIAIFHARTGQVTTVVPEGPLPLIQSNLSEQFMVEPVERNSVNIGTVMPMTEQRQARIALLNAQEPRVTIATKRLKQLRKENCQCTSCGSPQLINADYCEECNEKVNVRQAERRRAISIGL
jgi:hypothetical protein